MKAETKGALLLFLADALTLFLLLWGGLASILPVVRFQVDGGLVALWCVLLSAGSAALWSWRWGGWTALGLLAADALLVWRYWEELAFGIWLEGGYVDGVIEFLLLAFAAAWMLGWVVVRARCWYLAALLVLTPLLPAIINGILPDWAALTASTAGWGTMLLSALYGRRDKARLARGTLLGMGGMLLLLLTLDLALPREDYDRPQWATDARDSFMSAVSNGLSGDWALDWEMPEFLEGYLDLEVSGGAGSGSGGIGASFAVGEDGAVDLLNAGPRSYSGRTVLEISGGVPGREYLRGGTAAVYTGESWEEPAAEFEGGSLSPELFPALHMRDRTDAVMSIRSLYSGTTAYAPYGFTGFSNGVTLQPGGNAVKRRGLREYKVYYEPNLRYDGPLEGENAETELRYQEYVYENYLDVPQAARAALTPMANRMVRIYPTDSSGYPEQWQDAMYYAGLAAAILRVAAFYDLDTPAMEPGEDFVTHFLEEGRGYCVHFATAGALLLRMKGIPARYVSGYTYQADEDGSALVLDGDAHAWVEVYLDGLGWVIAGEMTPGYSEGQAVTVIVGEEEIKALPSGEDGSEEPEEPDEPELSEEPGEPDEPDSPEEPEEPDTPEASGTEEPAPVPTEPIDLSWLKPLAAAAAALGALFALYRWGMDLRRRDRELPDANRSVIRAYVRCRRLRHWGAEEVSELEELAQKAKFSQHTLTVQEREAAWTLLDETGTRVEEQLAPWKGRLFRWTRPVWF